MSELNSNIPPWMSLLVERLHSKRPEQRIQSAAEVEQLLQQCLAHLEQPLLTPLPECFHEPQRWTRKLTILIGTLIAGLATLIGLLITTSPLSYTEPKVVEATELIDKVDNEVPVESPGTLGVASAWIDGVENELEELETAVLALEQIIEND